MFGSWVAMMTRAVLWRCSRMVVSSESVNLCAEGMALSRYL